MAAASHNMLSVKASGASSRDVVLHSLQGWRLRLLGATLLAGRWEYSLCRPAPCLAVEAWVCDWAGRGNTAVRKGLAKERLHLVLKSWEVPWKLWVRGQSLGFSLHVERDCLWLKRARAMLSPLVAEEKQNCSASLRTEQGAGATSSLQGMAG